MTIATRAAAARPEETAGLLRELRKATTDWKDVGTISVWRCLLDLNTPESLLAAAMMLVPEGYPKWAVTGRNSATIGRKVTEDANSNVLDWSYAATPALALIAAIAASRGV